MNPVGSYNQRKLQEEKCKSKILQRSFIIFSFILESLENKLLMKCPSFSEYSRVFYLQTEYSLTEEHYSSQNQEINH